MPSLAAATALLLCVLSVLPETAADFDWQIVTGTSADYLERQVQRWAANGYRVQAILADASQPTIIVAREGAAFRRMPASAEYRVLETRDDAQVAALGREGFRIRALGKARSGPAIAIFERSLTPRGAAHDYRSLLAAPDADLDPLLAAVAREGYRIVAAAGVAGSEWLILERETAPREAAARDSASRDSASRDSASRDSVSRNGAARDGIAREAATRESRVIAAPDAEALETAINRLASEGFACDAVWNRLPKGFALLKGGTLMAALSRVRGAATPVAHVRIDKGRQPSESGQFIAVVPYRNGFVFAIRRASETDYSTTEVLFPENGSKDSWLEDATLERLRSQWWNPIEFAWAMTSAGRVSSWVGLERRAPIMRLSSAPAVARREADAVAVPPGATALPRGGGEPGDAYRAHLTAIARRDLAGAKALWTGKQRANWDKRVKDFKAPLGMGFSEKELFDSMRGSAPTDPIIVGGWIDGDRALVRVEATYNGTRGIADIDMVRESGVWKIAEQHTWKPLAA